jgi:hypothetical protein
MCRWKFNHLVAGFPGVCDCDEIVWNWEYCWCCWGDDCCWLMYVGCWITAGDEPVREWLGTIGEDWILRKINKIIYQVTKNFLNPHKLNPNSNQYFTFLSANFKGSIWETPAPDGEVIVVAFMLVVAFVLNTQIMWKNIFC